MCTVGHHRKTVLYTDRLLTTVTSHHNTSQLAFYPFGIGSTVSVFEKANASMIPFGVELSVGLGL